MRAALAKHKSTLTKLRLDTRKHYDSWPERDDGLVPPLGSELKQFTALIRVEAPASALIGWDENNVGGYDALTSVLPPNIEELKINEYAPRLINMLDSFVTICSEMYPNLRRLTISRVPNEIEEGGEVEQRLKKSFRDLAPELWVSFEDGSEIDHFEGSVASGSI